jgi:hypothetical protein
MERMGTNDQGVAQTGFFTHRVKPEFLATPLLFVISE